MALALPLLFPPILPLFCPVSAFPGLCPGALPSFSLAAPGRGPASPGFFSAPVGPSSALRLATCSLGLRASCCLRPSLLFLAGPLSSLPAVSVLPSSPPSFSPCACRSFVVPHFPRACCVCLRPSCFPFLLLLLDPSVVPLFSLPFLPHRWCCRSLPPGRRASSPFLLVLLVRRLRRFLPLLWRSPAARLPPPCLLRPPPPPFLRPSPVACSAPSGLCVSA